mmetsp:Transcript_34104/g.70438  ORF Transcript_34104/g.70438 Transcript_34104/m.70438 type:complete len:120 (+) Transcript_34104:553-912(+)
MTRAGTKPHPTACATEAFAVRVRKHVSMTPSRNTPLASTSHSLKNEKEPSPYIFFCLGGGQGRHCRIQTTKPNGSLGCERGVNTAQPAPETERSGVESSGVRLLDQGRDGDEESDEQDD